MSGERRLEARILLVDDQPVVRLGLAHLIGATTGLTVCGETDSGDQAVELARTLQPDVAIVGLALKLKHGSALDLVRALMSVVPGLRVLVFSTHDEELYAERALRAGARGYIMKQAPADAIIAAIRQILSGRIFVSDRMAQHLLSHLGHTGTSTTDHLSALSDRELEVLELIGRGAATSRIATQLGISIKTVETYRVNIKRKLHLRDAADLVRYATAWTEDL